MQRTAYLLLILTTLFWGGNAIAGKLAVGHVSPMLLTVLRWGLACLILYVIGRHRLAADWPAIRKALPLLVVLGFLGFSVYNLALYAALLYTSAINSSIEQASVSMFIFALNFLVFRVRVAVGQIAGFLLSFVGVALTASHGDPSTLLALDVNLGDALVLLAAVSYAVYTLALRYRPAIHWQSFMIVLSAVACVTSVPFAAGEHLAGTMTWPDARGWAIIAYTAILPSIVAQVFYIRGVEIIGPNRAGLFVNMVPIFGTLLAILLLGEEFHLYHAVAVVLTLGGIWLAEVSGRRLARGGR